MRRSFDRPELLPAAYAALQVLRQGARDPPLEEWRRQHVPAHLQLTEQGLDQAAAQLELRLANAGGVSLSPSKPGQPSGASAGSTQAVPQELVAEFLHEGPDTKLLRRSLEDLVADSLQLPTPAVHAHLVGSRLYGAALPDADLDIVVEIQDLGQPEVSQDTSRQVSMKRLLRLRRELEAEQDNMWKVEEMALDARRPTLRLRWSGLTIGVEVTFDQHLVTLAKSELLARACKEASFPKPGAVLLMARAWAQRRQICGQRQGYPSGYGLGLMVAYHWRRMGFLGALRPKSRQSLSFARSEAPENSSEVDAEMLAKFFQP
ncbi:unnamed protein product, partial [Effrenium voratum]